MTSSSLPAHHRAPNSPIGEFRKRSVPGRVHSVSKEIWFAKATRAFRVQPVVDSRHSRIAFEVLSSVPSMRKAATSNQSRGLVANPFLWLTTALQNHLFSVHFRSWFALYHLALGAPGDGTPNTWNWSTNEWGYRLESLGDGTMGHPVAPRRAR